MHAAHKTLGPYSPWTLRVATWACAVTLGVAAMGWAPARSDAQTPPEFVGSLSIAAQYHAAASLLPTRYPDQPETAFDEYQRLTEEALLSQRAISVQSCFATWWAYEFMGLQLTLLSQELRAPDLDMSSEAIAIERIGLRMWQHAKTILPEAGAACGIDLVSATDHEQWPSL